MSSIGGESPADKAASQAKPVKAIAGMTDLGRALGRDVPRSLKRTQELAGRIRRVSQVPPAKKAR